MKNIIYNVFHTFYVLLGKLKCNCYLICFKIRDRVSPPREDSILFVAHPDDEVLFFNKYILENKPYIVLMYTGWSLKRFKDFLKVMKHYGVRFRAYSTYSREPYDYKSVRRVTERHIASCLKIGDFKTVLTHNQDGDYGHVAHRVVHESVVKVCADKPFEILCPVSVEDVGKYPLSPEELENKKYIFDTMYKSEAWVMTEEEALTPIWFKNEKLERIN